MLRTGQLHRAPPRPRDLARRRGPRYRGPWRLPGPDSHRLAAVSLSLGYVVVLLLSVLLGARATGRTFLQNRRRKARLGETPQRERRSRANFTETTNWTPSQPIWPAAGQRRAAGPSPMRRDSWPFLTARLSRSGGCRSRFLLATDDASPAVDPADAAPVGGSVPGGTTFVPIRLIGILRLSKLAKGPVCRYLDVSLPSHVTALFATRREVRGASGCTPHQT